jgi:hypothetical protein
LAREVRDDAEEEEGEDDEEQHEENGQPHRDAAIIPAEMLSKRQTL